jgi:hypothetical protein
VEGNPFGWYGGDILSSSESEREFHVLKAIRINKLERPINHLEIKRLRRVAGPFVRTLKVKSVRCIPQKCSHTPEPFSHLRFKPVAKLCSKPHNTVYLASGMPGLFPA